MNEIAKKVSIDVTETQKDRTFRENEQELDAELHALTSAIAGSKSYDELIQSLTSLNQPSTDFFIGLLDASKKPYLGTEVAWSKRLGSGKSEIVSTFRTHVQAELVRIFEAVLSPLEYNGPEYKRYVNVRNELVSKVVGLYEVFLSPDDIEVSDNLIQREEQQFIAKPKPVSNNMHPEDLRAMIQQMPTK